MRAVGLDNVDVPAATVAGVMVVNARRPISPRPPKRRRPHARRRPVSPRQPGHSRPVRGSAASTAASELLDKTVGIVGFGRIGQLVAERLKGFGMTILAYDPYTPPIGRVSSVRAWSASRPARRVRLHHRASSQDPRTLGLIGKGSPRQVKPGVRIINTAFAADHRREALAEGRSREGRVGGAGLDVYAKADDRVAAVRSSSPSS